MSFAIETEHAVGGAIRLGGRIDVIDGSRTTFVTNAELLETSRPHDTRAACR